MSASHAEPGQGSTGAAHGGTGAARASTGAAHGSTGAAAGTAAPESHAGAGTAGRGATAEGGSTGAVRSVRVLLYSDDRATRDAVRLGVGRRPARDIEVGSWLEVATPAAVVAALDEGGFDVAVLDGEASPIGGLGLSKQLKNEVFDCPPILVLIGRPQDGWLAAWSQADLAVPYPLDPGALAHAVAELGRRTSTRA